MRSLQTPTKTADTLADLRKANPFVPIVQRVLRASSRPISNYRSLALGGTMKLNLWFARISVGVAVCLLRLPRASALKRSGVRN